MISLFSLFTTNLRSIKIFSNTAPGAASYRRYMEQLTDHPLHSTHGELTRIFFSLTAVRPILTSIKRS